MKKTYTLWAGALVASLLMSTTAFAAGPSVIIQRDNDSNNARLYLTGVSDDITSAEISLTSKQNLENTHFLGYENLAYSHHTEKDGTLTIYADALSAMEKQNDQIYLGNLTIPNDVSFTGVSKLITLNSKDAATAYAQVALSDDGSNNSGDGDNGNGGGSNGGGSNSGGSSSSNNNRPTGTTGRPAIKGDQTNGMIIANNDGSVSIQPHNGYEVRDVLVNGVSQGAVHQLLHLKSTDVVEVVFAPVQQPSTGSTNFSDVPANQWYAPAVSYVTQRGLFSGVSETQFAPHQSMTRGMLVSVLYRFNGTSHTGTSPFTDVSSGAWYGNAVSWAYANNLVSGVSDTSFAPNTPITREQAAVMLARYLKFSGIALENGTPDFHDTASISGYAKESVGAMQKAGLLSGDNAGNFHPDAQITRAEIASIFMRLCQKYGI
ncbi:S-layer homology domain-containing protein [Anaerotignum sp.]|uniref:S-layer homology domain-containing protein n=1 Tax=Anaerotignum sp. TaxID=2039241 RepID=UPI002A90A63D|nr:S-layer homology domain-containing protein [Anaerotignum sp.]MCI7657192.1 S-layer homology domain-containing protein [Clostridia bacterium]MDY5415611.1 S-layer homology domain-containing protein [Anaerotignum sp.]